MSADFDQQIDRAVREWLDVEPPADLRERVIERLSASSARLPASGFRLPASGWLLAPLAAAGLIVLAVFVARRHEPLPRVDAAARVDVYLAPEPRVLPVEPPVRPAGVPTIAAARTAPPAAAPAGLVAATSVADETVVIEPLKTLAPIAVRPITQDTIAPADLAMRPLNTIADTQIAPLTPPDRR